ncbi:MAG: RNA polymerase-associated protein rapA [Chromatiales bacterium]|jgi:hypothetical protein
MFKKSILLQSMLLAVAAPTVVVAEITTSMELKNETAFFTSSGQTIGQATSMLDTASDNSSGDLMKFENSARIFFNGDLGEDSTWHGEVKIIYDTEAVNDEDNGGVNYKGHENYSQQDYLRELYVDTKASDWYLRLGKQQVVWGTADGIKLLDIINPTDFREVNQNVMEDARIPIWMVNAERNVGDTGNFQFIVSQIKENKIPGLNRGGDQGQPFIMKGVDSITGQVNGFFNIAPALAKVADSFDNGAQGGAFDADDDGTGDAIATGLTAFSGLTVDGFAANTQQLNADTSIRAGGTPGVGSAPGVFLLDNIAQNGLFAGDPNGNNNVTNLVTSTAYVVGAGANNTFEYMGNATFATFNTFAANGSHASTVTTYRRDYPDDFNGNAGFRFKQSLDNGLNYSLNYFYHYDPNPVVDVTWHDASTGEQLTTVLATSGDFGAPAGPDFADPTGAAGGTTISRSAVPTTTTINGGGQATNATTVLLRNSAGQYYGSIAPNPTLTLSNNGTELRFTESLNRVHSFGTAMDYAFDTEFAPVVLRGEFLYDRDSKQVIVDKKLLGIGDLEGGLTTEDADYFKYVLGIDITVMTNLLVSGQFIQFRNLDYVNQGATCTTQSNAQGSTTNAYDCSRYTGDPSTLHLTNGLQRGWETKEFVSLFFSKPIGEDQLGRWNNITIYEEGGGWWNRFDAEYSISDQFIISGQWNNYWGDENTTFGQLDKSSSIQFGLKYIFE